MSWRLATAYSDYIFQLLSLMADPPYYRTWEAQGRGEPILLIPGFLAGDRTMNVMAKWLRQLGYNVHLSGMRWNVDCPNRTVVLLEAHISNIVHEAGEPVVIIGHSLGGALARYFALKRPEYVRHVISIGSPVDGVQRVHPSIAMAFRTVQTLRMLRGRRRPPCAPQMQCNCEFVQTTFSQEPALVGCTSIFSKDDEIVDWRSCIDPHGENQQVSGQHLGLIVNKEVYRVILSTLAQCCSMLAQNIAADPQKRRQVSKRSRGKEQSVLLSLDHEKLTPLSAAHEA